MSVTNKFKKPQSVWRSFFVTLFFVSAAALLFWLDVFRVYQSEIRLMVIGKTPGIAIDQGVDNMSELSKNLSFYEKMLEENESMEDAFEGYTKDQRKKLWNESVQVVRNEKSGVLSVYAKADTPEKAKRLSEATVKTLFGTATFYYNVKTDLDLRVVDGSIVKTIVDRPILYGVVSFGSAVAVVGLFFGLLFWIPLLLERRGGPNQTEIPVGASVPYIDPRKFIPARPATLTFKTDHDTRSVDDEKDSKVLSSHERMLPGMDTELPFQFEESYPEESDQQISTEEIGDLPVTGGFVADRVTPQAMKAPIPKGEPTVEEYKRRLNELLAGGK